MNEGSRLAVEKATAYANRPYEEYTGQRVAPLSENEQAAVRLAGEATGRYGEDINAARSAIGEGMQRFTDADIEAYMNPYIKGALDPVAREISEATARERESLAGSLSSRGAFSGSRAILADREAQELGAQRYDDLYKKGYASAFEDAASRWQADREASFRGANDYLKLAGVESSLISQDIQNMMSTGGVQRAVEQAGKDFDYQQFVEARDWDVRQAQVMVDTLKGIKDSYNTKQTTKTKGSALGSILGAATTIGGFFMGGGMQGMMGGMAGNTGGTTGTGGKTSWWQGALQGGMAGAQVGGPWGAVAGGVIGALGAGGGGGDKEDLDSKVSNYLEEIG